MTGIWALVPLKTVARAKQRLVSELDGLARRELVMAMAKDVLAALSEVRAIQRVVLVCNDPEAVSLTHPQDIDWFRAATASGLNEELSAAADHAEERGATAALVVHADLPLITAPAAEQFLASAPGVKEIRIVPCKDEIGTNVLLAPLPFPMPLRFGRNSCAAFTKAARIEGHELQVIRNASLSLDIDSPRDLRTLKDLYVQGRVPRGATRQLLERCLGSAGQL